ncbi:hypothetical protein GE09DRAFT_1144612 [Coniochaeta sp. 2T2.1]|nr:hypothetical protein GE09DRAFT_1144612 [Coniochaeta sp. 2T2.1]
MPSAFSNVFSLSVIVLGSMPRASAVVGAQTCYYPNGAIASDQVPCSDAQFSACCHRNAICLSNNLCMGIKQPFTLGRGSCTDPEWQSERCPQQCQTAQPASGCSIILLNSTAGVNSYCCNSLVLSPGKDQPVCDVGSPFFLPDATPVEGRGALAAIANTNPPSSTSSTPSSSETSSPASLSTSTTSQCPSTTAVSPACGPSNGTAPVADKPQPYRDAAIGVGVGVPLGVMAIGFLAWAMWERRKRKKTEQNMVAAKGSDGDVAKYAGTESGSWQAPPPNFYQSQRQSRIREMYHVREPAELN